MALHNVVVALLHLLGAMPHSNKTYLWLRVFIDENGIPRSVEPLKLVPAVAMSPSEKQRHADTVLGWVFAPKLVKGEKVSSYKKFPIEIHLDEAKRGA